MSKYPFSFIIQGYSTLGNEPRNYLEHGVGFCETYADAAKQIEEFYGDELIAIKHIELYEERSLITLPKGSYEEMVDCLESYENVELECDAK